MEGFEKSTENALWAALRALEEKESLAEKILLRAAFEKSEEMDYFSEKVKKIKQHINIIRDILNRNE
jgi:two-component system chemotaxis response regulator CheB